MDGNGALFGTLSGNTREVLHKFTVDLPKKHGKISISFPFLKFFLKFLMVTVILQNKTR